MSLEDMEAKYEAEIRREHKNLFVREVAKRRHTEVTAARDWSAPDDLGSLTDMLSMEWPDEPYLIQGILPEDGNVVLTAQFKTGKTTFVGNVVRSLVDGTPFLGAYDVTRTGPVALWNYELTARMQIQWLRDLRIENTDRVHALHLRGRRMPLLSPAARKWAVAWLKERQISTWIIDPWGPALAGTGGDENSNTDSRALLTILDEIKLEAGVRELIIATHTGRGEQSIGTEHARGATVLDDWPDARWILTRANGTEQRFIRFAGRIDSEIPETALDYDHGTRALSLLGGGDPLVSLSRKEVMQAARLKEWGGKVLAYVTENPGCSQAQIRSAVSIHDRDIRATVAELEKKGQVRTEMGKRSSVLHYPAVGDLTLLPSGHD